MQNEANSFGTRPRTPVGPPHPMTRARHLGRWLRDVLGVVSWDAGLLEGDRSPPSP